MKRRGVQWACKVGIQFGAWLLSILSYFSVFILNTIMLYNLIIIIEYSVFIKLKIKGQNEKERMFLVEIPR